MSTCKQTLFCNHIQNVRIISHNNIETPGLELSGKLNFRRNSECINSIY